MDHTEPTAKNNVIPIKKKSATPDGWKFKPGSVIPCDYEIGHYPFFVYGKHQGGIKTVPFCGGYWRLDSTEYPDFDDLDVLLGIVKLIEDQEHRGKEVADAAALSEFYGKMKEYPVKIVYTSLRELLSYSGKTFGKNQVIALKNTIHRLSIFTATKFTNNGNDIRQFKFMFPYEIVKVGKRDKVKLLISVDFLLHCREINRMLIHWRSIQQLNTQLEKAIFLYLEMNRRPVATEDRLLKFLGVVPPEKPKDSASKKEKAIYELNLESFQNRKYKVVSDLIHETLPAMAACGRLARFDAKTHVRASGKGKRYFLLLKNIYYEMEELVPNAA